MTLAEFIKCKPEYLRLGQWFVNCYWKGSDKESQFLYQLDGRSAATYITDLMESWQWNELPNIKEE